MNNRELEELLKAAEPPARDARYWESFPSRVQSQPATQYPPKAIANPHRPALQLWKLGFAATGFAITLFLVLKFASTMGGQNEDLRLLRNCYRESASLFSGQLKALRIESGAFYLDLSDKPDVPRSAPLYVRACKHSQCGAAVTFSGQQIELLGQKFEVLVDGRGGIMLLTPQGLINSDSAGLDRVEIGWLDQRL